MKSIHILTEEIQMLRDLLNMMGTGAVHFHDPLFVFYSQQLDEKINDYYELRMNAESVGSINRVLEYAI